MIFTDKYGHKRNGKRYVCLECKTEFIERLVPAQKTKPKYCSRACFNDSRRNRIVVVCDQCGVEFDRAPNKLKNSKHGKTFCSRECKDYAQSFLGNCPDIHPPHYDANNPHDYRQVAFREFPNQCVDCGIDIKYMLIVHHIDGDRVNNDLSNLEIVCPNHHILRHVKHTKNGWIYCSQSLTPRDKAEALVAELADATGLSPVVREA